MASMSSATIPSFPAAGCDRWREEPVYRSLRRFHPAVRSADTQGVTAPRTCRACGAELHGDVMWCLRCYEPVHQLTAAQPQLPVVHPVPGGDGRPHSRWKAGATTFGPLGRVVVTALVLAFAPTSLGNPLTLVVYLPAYLVIAAKILRSTWRKDLVATPTRLAPSGERPEPVREPVPISTVVGWGVLITLMIGVGIAWTATDQEGHGIIAMVASLVALLLAVRWLPRG